MRTPDLVDMVVHRRSVPAPTNAAEGELAQGTAADPVCGMTVELDGAITLELDGVTHAFCCTGCRDVFLARWHQSPRS